MTTQYAHDEVNKLGHAGWNMDRETLVRRIPNSAAFIFALGLTAILASIVARYFTDGDFPTLALGLGFGLAATGQWIGEKAMSNGR